MTYIVELLSYEFQLKWTVKVTALVIMTEGGAE